MCITFVSGMTPIESTVFQTGDVVTFRRSFMGSGSNNETLIKHFNGFATSNNSKRWNMTLEVSTPGLITYISARTYSPNSCYQSRVCPSGKYYNLEEYSPTLYVESGGIGKTNVTIFIEAKVEEYMSIYWVGYDIKVGYV